MATRRNRLPWALAAALLVLLAVAGAAIAAAEQTRQPRFELVSRANPGQPYNGDVVAHRGHAYLSSWSGRACRSLGVRVYSLAHVRRPSRVSTFADATSQPRLAGTWTEKTIVRSVSTESFQGDLAVTSVQDCRAGSFQGFALYDVSDPAQPRELALVATQPRGAHELWLQRVGSRVYVWAALPGAERSSAPNERTPGAADFRIWDVSDPRAPRQVGEWGVWQELGVKPDAAAPDRFLDWAFVHSVTGNAAGTRAYLSYWDLGTVILDVSDPARPRYVGRTASRLGTIDNAHSTWLAKGGRVMVETLERDGGRPSFWNIANPARPVKLSEFRLPRAVIARGRSDHLERISGLDLQDSVHDAKVVGNTAYFSWYRQGVVAVDITNARKPRFLARYLPPPSPDEAGSFCPSGTCRSVWGVHPYGQYLLASDMVGGLYVLRLRR
jgi:hypothetical protein